MPTEEARRRRIQAALNAYEQEQGRKETLTVEWRGNQTILPVVKLDLDVVLLNTHSHRLKAQLEDHPEREDALAAPWEESAQDVVADILKTAHRDFEALKGNLAEEGQHDAGLVTREGVLINANTRAVSLRELNDPNRRWIKVGVLPADADPQELAELELRLQVQKELRDPYSLTNELLFIEDMFRTFNKSAEQIALDLRWATNTPRELRRGSADVEQRRRILALIREMQRVSTPPIELTFFDDKLEQLKALETRYNSMILQDPEAARRFRDNWLFAARAGSSSVHDLRAVDEDFAVEYLRPRMAEDERVGPVIEPLLTQSEQRSEPQPRGVDVLDPGRTETPDPGIDVRPLINAFSPEAPRTVTFTRPDGKRLTIETETIRDAARTATRDAIRDFRAQGRVQNRIDEPIAVLREAVVKLRRAKQKFKDVHADPAFGQARRGKFEYQVNQAKKAVTELEQEVGRSPTRR